MQAENLITPTLCTATSFRILNLIRKENYKAYKLLSAISERGTNQYTTEVG